jgi:curved DNA-binding protein
MAVECREYYEVLGVAKNATADESGQRPQLARKHHHGVNPGDIRRRNSTRSTKLSRFCRIPKNVQRYDALGPIGKAGEEFRPLPGCEDAYVQQNHSFAFRLSG